MFATSALSYAREKVEEKGLTHHIQTGVISLIFIAIVMRFWPELFPFGLFQFWKLEGSVVDIFVMSWPLFAWGFFVNAIKLAKTRNHPNINRHAEGILVVGLMLSAMAGVGEEIAFRWLLFYSEIWGIQLTNWLFFGFAGFGIPEWFYYTLAEPIANYFTLGHLQTYLLDGFGWAVGAAIIGSNGKFRDGHIYQGTIGWITAWFAGMFFFWLMFNHGLFAAMIVHFTFDLFVYTLVYIDAAIERAQGWVY